MMVGACFRETDGVVRRGSPDPFDGGGGWGRFGGSEQLAAGASWGESFGEVPAGGGLAGAEVGGFPGGGDELLGIGDSGGKDTVKLPRKLLLRVMENGLGAAISIPRMGVD